MDNTSTKNIQKSNVETAYFWIRLLNSLYPRDSFNGITEDPNYSLRELGNFGLSGFLKYLLSTKHPPGETAEMQVEISIHFEVYDCFLSNFVVFELGKRVLFVRIYLDTFFVWNWSRLFDQFSFYWTQVVLYLHLQTQWENIEWGRRIRGFILLFQDSFERYPKINLWWHEKGQINHYSQYLELNL